MFDIDMYSFIYIYIYGSKKEITIDNLTWQYSDFEIVILPTKCRFNSMNLCGNVCCISFLIVTLLL